MRRPDAPDPIGHACARALTYTARLCPVCRTFCRTATGYCARHELTGRLRRIRAGLDADAREHVRQLLTTSANWNPWQPVRSGRYARNVALRQLAIGLARLTVATSAVWLAVVVWLAWH